MGGDVCDLLEMWAREEGKVQQLFCCGARDKSGRLELEKL